MLKLVVDEAMREQGARAEMVALGAEISLTTLYAYINNKRNRVSFDILEKIAAVLSVSALSLIREVENEDNDNQHDQGIDQGY